MSHARQQIRDAFVTALAGISTPATESRILKYDSLPAVNVYTTDESAEPGSMGGINDRTVNVVIEARVSGSAIDDSLDSLAVEIEEGIAAVSIVCTVYQSTEIEFDAEADKPYGIMRITYAVSYMVAASDVETIRG